MLRTFPALRSTVRLAILLPIAAIAVGCSSEGGSDGGPSSEGGTGAPGGDGGAGTDGANDTPDTVPPTVVSHDPADAALGVSTTAEISVLFSEEMAALTITSGATFTLATGGAVVPGTVTYFEGVASFAPSTDLALDTTYTATIATAATDEAGNPLATAYHWSFKTDATAPAGPAPVPLGAAGKYVILAKTAITNVPTSAITGNVALSPAAASYITGFGLTRAGTKWTTPQVTGGVFAADNDPPSPSNLTTAIGNMESAYTNAAGRPTPTFLNVGGGAIGGATLTPGLYKWTSSVTVPTNVVLAGGANDVWIFQVTGDLTVSASKAMTLSGGARAKNVFWQVAGIVDIGTSAHAEGVVLSKTAIKLGTGASINGRLLAQTAVNLAGSTVTAPAL